MERGCDHKGGVDITEPDGQDRLGLSLRLGIGLGIVWGLLFVACRVNIASDEKSATLATILLVALLIAGLWKLWLPDFICALSDRDL